MCNLIGEINKGTASVLGTGDREGEYTSHISSTEKETEDEIDLKPKFLRDPSGDEIKFIMQAQILVEKLSPLQKSKLESNVNSNWARTSEGLLFQGNLL
ncbi:hypothetical protein O181_024841 [Austropuccinia psidii MF-1]|uniref:Uncharacterized protein n=1 Tax=Austropuccinia psidii MF-1 TaxID=1389203 RepID=A0A9Q3GYZ8_9BASI|nr:hypothetical protein [Austropuccinia psidii MF-1]